MSISEHERQYTPSQWSKRYGHEEIFIQFTNFAQKVTKEARENYDCELDVSYGPTERSKYDIYGTDLPKDAPIFVFIHGGYWQEMSKDLACFPVPVLVRNGIKVIVLEYDLCPDVNLSSIIKQTKLGLEHIFHSIVNSTTRGVWISGHSAGAHLSASILYDDTWLAMMREKNHLSSLKGIVLISGIFQLRPLLDTTFNDSLKLTEKEIESFSFSNINTRQKNAIQGIKVLVTVGECDSPIFIKESREISQSLINFVDDVEYLLLRDSIDHFDIVENLINPCDILTKKILNYLSL